MRRPLLLSLGLLPLAAACNPTASAPAFSTLGAWRSQSFAPATVQLTLVETARSSSGAGRWVTPTEALAFRVTGAHSGSDVSLLFDFDGRADITFEGRFRQQTIGEARVSVMAGQLYGGGFRGDSLTLVPVEDAGS